MRDGRGTLRPAHSGDRQEFTPEATARAFDYSQGQPWLVNAIAREITREMRAEPPEPVTAGHVDRAKERLIDLRKILTGFAEFWRANGEILVAGEGYHETAPQLVFMAYLQ